MSHDILGGFQQLVMLAVLRLGDEAYGARLQLELDEIAGRTVSISTVYVTMERLERKGLVASWLADPTPVRGGRSKRFYQLTDEGVLALQEAREALDKMWDGLEASPRLGS